MSTFCVRICHDDGGGSREKEAIYSLSNLSRQFEERQLAALSTHAEGQEKHNTRVFDVEDLPVG